MKGLGGNGMDIARGYVEAGIAFSQNELKTEDQEFTEKIAALSELLFDGDELEAYEFLFGEDSST